jgi:CBS domain-containing protein
VQVLLLRHDSSICKGKNMMTKPAKRLTAEELMQRDVVTVAADDSLRDALKLMTENHVTGLPVMDRTSRCIGLVTATDILNYEDESANDSAAGTTQFFDPDSEQWEDVPILAFSSEDLANVQVAEVMSRDLIWVDRDTTISDVAKRMVTEHVHRVLVMNERSQLYGIISTFDFVRLAAE